MVLVHGGMAQNVGPVLEMVTEKYLLRSKQEWNSRQEALAILDTILDALKSGDIEAIGKATNNVAEYRALIAALEGASRAGVRELDLHLDAELIVKQMTGAYKVKNADLKPLWQEAQGLTREFDRWSIRHIPRRENAVADALVNQALDEE